MLISRLKDYKSFPDIVSVDYTTRITSTGDNTSESKIFTEPHPFPSGTLKIGRYCSIASRVSFLLSGNHNIKRITTWIPDHDSSDISLPIKTNGDIIVESDVWIGMGSVIMSGTKIGIGSVIGANSVVSGDIPPYSIIVGNPGRIIRQRFDDRQINILLNSKWWEWDIEFVNKNRHVLFSEDFSLFENLVASLEKHSSAPS